ncbi:MAG TPA: universal stress protein [Acidimicrobiales bacterium]|nr:universal stress protein [Acidimicrobiales bacterium]
MTAEPSSGTSRIVVGFDGSDSSTDALAWAVRQADLTAATLEVVMTWEWPTSYGWSVPIPDGFDPESDVRKALDIAVAGVLVDHPGLKVNPRLVNGHPAPALVEASKGADLLVVGSRGHGEFVGMLVGSVSEHCVTNAHCPVLVHRVPG